jgi:multiple sugar transport system permease protein
MSAVISKMKVKSAVKHVLIRLNTIGLMAFVLFPFVWLLLSSVKPPVDLLSKPPVIIPKELTFRYYAKVLQNESFIDSLLSSLTVSVFTTLLCLILGTFGAYVFARIRFPGRNSLFLALLGTQMLPHICLMIPIFVLMRISGLLYTYQGLILANITFSLPYVIWMYHSFLVSLPAEIEEASRIDGCTRLQTIFKIMFPLSVTGLITTGIFVFIGAWNEFMLSSVLTNSSTRTLPMAIVQLIGEDRISLELLFPAGVISCLPVLLLVLYFQRYIVQGLTDGAVK